MNDLFRAMPFTIDVSDDVSLKRLAAHIIASGATVEHIRDSLMLIRQMEMRRCLQASPVRFGPTGDRLATLSDSSRDYVRGFNEAIASYESQIQNGVSYQKAAENMRALRRRVAPYIHPPLELEPVDQYIPPGPRRLHQ